MPNRSRHSSSTTETRPTAPTSTAASEVRGRGTRSLATPPRSPTANPFGERVIGTLRRDCFDHIIVKDEQHAECVVQGYLSYYHGRPHRLRMQSPDGARHLPLLGRHWELQSLASRSSVVLHHRYGFTVREPHCRWNSVPLEPRMIIFAPQPEVTSLKTARTFTIA
jgi:hypothetical protein